MIKPAHWLLVNIFHFASASNFRKLNKFQNLIFDFDSTIYQIYLAVSLEIGQGFYYVCHNVPLAIDKGLQFSRTCPILFIIADTVLNHLSFSGQSSKILGQN